MAKVAVVFWSGTGNTEAMANEVLAGAQGAGAEATLYTASDFNDSLVDGFDAIAFGCPSMGSEELEDTEFEPMFQGVESKLSGKKVGLFGSYGWGDGEWMRNWEEQVKGDGANLVSEGVICNEAPDDDAAEKCRNLGKALA